MPQHLSRVEQKHRLVSLLAHPQDFGALILHRSPHLAHTQLVIALWCKRQHETHPFAPYAKVANHPKPATEAIDLNQFRLTLGQ